jgi:hypothetical protein
MPNTLRIKRRLTGASGAPSSLAVGELAYSKVDNKLWIGLDDQIKVLAGEGHFATNSDLASEVSTLNSSISSETSRATAAEAALGVRIDNVLSNTTQGSLDSLTEVVAAFEAADSNLNGAITSLANSASSALTAEVNRATAAEGVIAAGLAQELLDRAAADTTLQGNINTVAGNLSSETSARQAADTTLQNNIDSEASTRASAISALDSRVVALEGASADARLDEVESDIAAIESAATALTGRVSTLETTAAGLGTMSTQNANNVAITGGTIEGIELDGGSF